MSATKKRKVGGAAAASPDEFVETIKAAISQAEAKHGPERVKIYRDAAERVLQIRCPGVTPTIAGTLGTLIQWGGVLSESKGSTESSFDLLAHDFKHAFVSAFTSSSIDRSTALIRDAIDLGFPLFNAGEKALCADIYAETAEQMLDARNRHYLGANGKDSSKEKLQLERALKLFKSLDASPHDTAWALRRALNAVLKLLLSEDSTQPVIQPSTQSLRAELAGPRPVVVMLHGGGDPFDTKQLEESTCEVLARRGAHLVANSGAFTVTLSINDFVQGHDVVEQADLVVFVMSTWWGGMGRCGNSMNSILGLRGPVRIEVSDSVVVSLFDKLKQRGCFLAVMDLGVSDHAAGVALHKYLHEKSGCRCLPRACLDSRQTADRVEDNFFEAFRSKLQIVAAMQRQACAPFTLCDSPHLPGPSGTAVSVFTRMGYRALKVDSIVQAVDGSKAVKLVTLKSQDSLEYDCGAHLVRLANNPPEEADALIACLRAPGGGCLSPEMRVKFNSTDHGRNPTLGVLLQQALLDIGPDGPHAEDCTGNACSPTVREILIHMVSLRQTPRRRDVLEVLVRIRDQVRPELMEGFEKLLDCTLDPTKYANECEGPQLSLAEILQKFPRMSEQLFGFQEAFHMLSSQSPRYYSIASLANGTALDLLVSQTEVKRKGEPDPKSLVGLSSGELTNQASIGSTIFARIKANPLWHPYCNDCGTSHLEVAVICIGAAAFAPARATLELWQSGSHVASNRLILYLGVRSPADIPCRHDLLKARAAGIQFKAHLGLSGGGDISGLHNLFHTINIGRMGALLEEQADDLKQVLRIVLTRGAQFGRVLICGEALFARPIRSVVGKLALQVSRELRIEHGMQTEEQMSDWLLSSGAYTEDTVVSSAFKYAGTA